MNKKKPPKAITSIDDVTICTGYIVMSVEGTLENYFYVHDVGEDSVCVNLYHDTSKITFLIDDNLRLIECGEYAYPVPEVMKDLEAILGGEEIFHAKLMNEDIAWYARKWRDLYYNYNDNYDAVIYFDKL